MAKVFGIHFAPLNVPLERRLQTAVVALYFTLFFIAPVVLTVLFVYGLFTKYYYLPLLYFVWLWYDRDTCCKGGRRCYFPTQLDFWKRIHRYFPAHLIKTVDLDPNRNYIFACHPHGVLCTGIIIQLGYKTMKNVFPGITIFGITLRQHFFWPIMREVLLAAGMCSSTERSINFLLSKNGNGNGVVITPGGSAEAMEAHPGSATLVLNKRKGFIRIAVKNGVPLVPVYTFGETDLFTQISNPEGSLVRKIQDKFKDIFGIPLYLFCGRGIFQYSFGMLPKRTPLYTVVGQPIEVEKIDNPSETIINTYHAKYVESLQKLFDEYKVKLGGHFKNQVLILK